MTKNKQINYRHLVIESASGELFFEPELVARLI